MDMMKIYLAKENECKCPNCGTETFFSEEGFVCDRSSTEGCKILFNPCMNCHQDNHYQLMLAIACTECAYTKLSVGFKKNKGPVFEPYDEACPEDYVKILEAQEKVLDTLPEPIQKYLRNEGKYEGYSFFVPTELYWFTEKMREMNDDGSVFLWMCPKCNTIEQTHCD